jgi:hypothetical protein
MLPPLAFGGTLLATVWASVPHSYASFWPKAHLPCMFPLFYKEKKQTDTINRSDNHCNKIELPS